MVSPSILADPNSALANARALIEKDPERAASQARALLKGTYDDAPALLVLARSLRRLGKAKEAKEHEKKAIAAWSRNPHHIAAANFIRQGNSLEANRILHRLKEEDPDNALALILFGSQAAKADEYQLAEQLLKRAVELVPSEPGARIAYAELLHRSKRFAESIAELDKLDPVAREGHHARLMRSDNLAELGQVEEQIEVLRDLSKTAPKPEFLNLRMGHALRALGKPEEAEKAYRDMLVAIPNEGAAWWSLAQLQTVKFSDDDVAAMRALLDQPNVNDINRIRVNFALGRALEMRREPGPSFRHYAEGNRIRSELTPHDPEMISDWVARSETAFTRDFFEKRQDLGAPDEDPIFIVGMQRSGSTLVEQILASHPLVEGTAELPDIPNMVRQLGEEAVSKGGRFEQLLEGMDEDRLKSLGRDYLELAALHRKTGEPRFTDKMPNNWMHIALIKTILPNARIIDVRRDPMDCCFSNFKQLYARGLNHSFKLDHMGRFYADYVRLMHHYDQALPGAVHRIIYEELVEDVEGEARRMLDYLGLEFDPACLEFHKTDRAVQTISASQVRQPINRKGIGAWKAFEPWLDPLSKSLGDTVDTWRK